MLSYKIIDQGNWSAYGSRLGITNPSYQIFSDRDHWEIFWFKEYKRPAPKIDFKKYFVIYITLGQKKSGGYSLSIVNAAHKVNESNGVKIKIVLEIEEPSPGQGVDLGETNPFVVAQIESPIVFDNNTKVNRWQTQFVKQRNGQHLPVDIQVIQQQASND